MSNPYVGEIRMFGGNFAPAGWMLCQGQLLPISEYETLFNLIGTTYGGDGQSTFALPNLQSRVPIHMGQGVSNYILGETGGVESVTLNTNQIAIHNHTPLASSITGNAAIPTNNVWAAQGQVLQFVPAAPDVTMDPQALGSSGGSQPHDNMLPFLAVNFIISMFGVFPSQ